MPPSLVDLLYSWLKQVLFLRGAVSRAWPPVVAIRSQLHLANDVDCFSVHLHNVDVRRSGKLLAATA